MFSILPARRAVFYASERMVTLQSGQPHYEGVELASFGCEADVFGGEGAAGGSR